MVKIQFTSGLSRRLNRRGGFTLIEILIVGALIVLFSGLAIINMQRFFDDASRKAMFGEAKEIATAMSFAHNDLGYYPRIPVLGLPATLVTFTQGGVQFLRPGFDTYGYFPALTPQAANVATVWKGPYLGISNQHNTVLVRLTDSALRQVPATGPGGDDFSLIRWPADKWGHPWMIYLVKSDPAAATANNPLGLRLINSPTEEADYMTAVVSYGPNGFPGGNDQTQFTDPNIMTTVLQPGALFVPGDVTGQNVAQFSLKSFSSTNPTTLITPSTFNPLLAQSLKNGAATLNTGGILDSNVDDVVIRF